MTNFLWVMLGGAMGSAMRYAVWLLFHQRLNMVHPYATLVVNLLGSFLLGAIVGLSARSPWWAHQGRLLLGVGLCGSFTTFSTFSVENLKLMQNGQHALALAYISLSLVGGLLAAWGGYALFK